MKKGILTTTALLGSAAYTAAQTGELTVAKGPSVYQSPVFYALVLVAVLLLIFILQLGKVFGAMAEKYGKNEAKKKWDSFKSIALLIALSAVANQSNGQLKMPEKPTQAMFLHEGFGNTSINALVVIILIELAVVFYYMMLIRSFTRQNEPTLEIVKSRAYFWDRLNKSVAIESESAILTDHNYDGIRELDNALPPWWKYGFYLTIVWGVAYIAHYHVTRDGQLQAVEYETEMLDAAVAIAEYRAKAADAVDEKTVTRTTNATFLQQGAIHYDKLCKVCHGASGEGLVGPNLTDNFWLHGGDIKNVFTTIKYGIQGKGMKSWQQELSASEMAKVANYIMSLQGTQPANAKAAEGDLYIENPASASDSTITKDSTTVVK